MDPKTAFQEIVEENLGASPDAARMARGAFQSRFHFHRRFRSALGESPVRLMRRLNLERAAWSLRATEKEITRIALESGYASHEGFTRAFKKAFGLSPREYRRASERIRTLPGGSGLHFDPQTNLKGTTPMDLTDRLLTTDYAEKRQLLECGKLLTASQLDAPLAFRHTLTPFVEPARTLRESLARLVDSGWMDQMFLALGYEPQNPAYRTLDGDSPEALLAKLESFHGSLRAFVSHVREHSLWAKEWVDAACEPPETFPIGQVIEETLTWDIAYRVMLKRQLQGMGFTFATP